MIEYFDVVFLAEVEVFLLSLDAKIRNKIVYNIDKSRYLLDPKLFKKLNEEIWEFRTTFKSVDYRLLAFWDKSDDKKKYSCDLYTWLLKKITENI